MLSKTQPGTCATLTGFFAFNPVICGPMLADGFSAANERIGRMHVQNGMRLPVPTGSVFF
jgi:hypothetical protein